ncbi:hypothetical protein [Serratia quinivorans]|uniref:hypothetical protein n=1 Tax=Serratia quinivorans TaxID=137545 RepID=UPI003981F476
MVIFDNFLATRNFFTAAFIFLVMALTGCSATSPLLPQGEISSRENAIALLHCDRSVNTDNTTPPVEIYQSMVHCANKHAWGSAVLLFALAGSDSWYYATTTGSPEAKKQHSVLLAEAMQRLNHQPRQQLWQHIQATLGDTQQLTKVCQILRLTGHPDYSITPEKRTEINPDEYWQAALKNYLHCAVNR